MSCVGVRAFARIIMEKNIFEVIRSERQDFLQNEVNTVGTTTHSQYATVKKVHNYYTGHFENGDYEEINGVKRKKTFYNISAWRCEVATKMIDLDVKDFMLVPNNPDQDTQVYLLEKELKHWLKKHDFGELLNEVVRYLPIYGSAVIRKYGNDDVRLVDLRNLYVDQSAKCLESARYVIVRNLMTVPELAEMKGTWDNVDEALEKFQDFGLTVGYDQIYDKQGVAMNPRSSNSPFIEVWERFGQIRKSFITNKESDYDTWVYGKMVVAGIDTVKKNDNGVITQEDGVVLWAEEIEECPFKEVHYTKQEGRWLGVGIVEMLFEVQRRVNEIKNQEARALELASIQLFQTRDQTVGSNLITDFDVGDMVQVTSEITPIATESRNLVGFQNAMSSYEQLADRMTFSYDIVRGEQAPASATLGAVQLQSQQAGSVFDYKRENIGLFLSEFIEDIVFPVLEKEFNKEHILRLTGSVEEINKIRNNYAQKIAVDKLVDYMLDPRFATGELPAVTEDIYNMFVQEAKDELTKDGEKVWVKVTKNFFKNLDYYVDIVVTGENKNIFAQIGNAQAILGFIAQDPTVTSDPAKRTLFFKMLSGLGMHISEIQDIENQITQSQAQPTNLAPQGQNLMAQVQQPQVTA